MAEIATIARPYAEALFRSANAGALANEVAALGAVASDPQLQQFADNPKVSGEQVFNVVADVVARKGVLLAPAAQNFLKTVIANGRLAALPTIAQQFHDLLNAKSGVADAQIESAFPMDERAVAELLPALEKRFGGKLKAQVRVVPELIGGVRVTVGDEVLDTSVAARLQQMKAALTA
jgi:F-type H+-transporting ATPase subunit delta